MPTPFSTSLFMNRFINSEKLCLIKYTTKPTEMTMKQFVKKHDLPKESSMNIVGNVRPMTKKDVSTVLKLFNDQQSKYKVHYKMSHDDVMHHLLPKEEFAPKSQNMKVVKDAAANTSREVPEYLSRDEKKLSGQLLSIPQVEQIVLPLPINIALVCEFLAHTH